MNNVTFNDDLTSMFETMAMGVRCGYRSVTCFDRSERREELNKLGYYYEDYIYGVIKIYL